MEYRYLGRSGLKVSVLSFGAMTLGGTGLLGQIGSDDLAGARRQIDICLDHGVNLIDTANTYGRSEAVVGEAVAGRRDKLLIATKARFPIGSGPNDQGNSRKHLTESLEASLRKLKTDYVDLFQLHGWDAHTPLEESLGALDTLVKAGKVRYVGVSNHSAWHLMKVLGTAERCGFVRPVSHQLYYSLASREAEYELTPVAVDQGVGTLVWGPLAGGLLSGKYRRGQAAPSGSRGDLPAWSEYPVRDREQLYDVVETLLDIASGRGVSAATVALSWLRDKAGIASLIMGARTDEQLLANLAAAELTLSPEERKRLDDASALPLIYPYWHQARHGRERLGPADLTLLGDVGKV